MNAASVRCEMADITHQIKMSTIMLCCITCHLMLLRHIADASSLIAFNCSHPETTAVEFSLLSQGACPDFSETGTEETIDIQLIQRREFRDVHAFSAKVVRTLHILPCSGNIVTDMLTQRVLEVSRKEVMMLYNANLFKDEFITLNNIPHNGSYTANRNVKGWSHENSRYCGGVTFTLYGRTYEDAVLASQYDILTRDGLIVVDLNRNMVNTFGGTTCEFTEGHCVDYIYGDVFWNPDAINVEDCHANKFIVLYDGSALLRTYPATKVTAPRQIVTVVSKSTAFSLILTKQIMLCRQHAFESEHPKLYIVRLRHLLRYFTNTAMHTLDVNIDVYRSSKFIHMERHFGTQLKQLNANVMRQICRLEIQTIANLQAIASLDPAEFAYAYKKKPGFSAILRGEVIHVLKCIRVAVHVRPSNNCYHELPVTYMNDSFYLHPRTHVLIRHGSEVECTPLYPVKYRLQNQWYTLSPNLVQSTAPRDLTTSINFTEWEYQKLFVGTTGIYSPADLDRQRSRLLFPIELKAITRTIASTASGYNSGRHGLDMLALIDPVHLRKTLQSYWEDFESAFRTFGSYSGAIIMIGMVYKALLHLCNGGLHFTVISRLYGWVCGMLACICPGLANLAIIYGREEIKNTGQARATILGTVREYRRQHQSDRVPEASPEDTHTSLYPTFDNTEAARENM